MNAIMTMPKDQHSRAHRFALYLQIWLFLVPLTGLYLFAAAGAIWTALEDLEFRLLLVLPIPGVFVWTGWVIAAATVRGPRAASEVSRFWWRLNTIASVSVAASWMLLSSAAQYNDSSVPHVILFCCAFGVPLLPLSVHCWWLRRQYG